MKIIACFLIVSSGDIATSTWDVNDNTICQCNNTMEMYTKHNCSLIDISSMSYARVGKLKKFNWLKQEGMFKSDRITQIGTRILDHGNWEWSWEDILIRVRLLVTLVTRYAQYRPIYLKHTFRILKLNSSKVLKVFWNVVIEIMKVKT